MLSSDNVIILNIYIELLALNHSIHVYSVASEVIRVTFLVGLQKLTIN